MTFILVVLLGLAALFYIVAVMWSAAAIGDYFDNIGISWVLAMFGLTVVPIAIIAQLTT